MKLRRLELPSQTTGTKNVRIVSTGNAGLATLVAVLNGQGKFEPVSIEPNGTSELKLPSGNYMFHIGFLSPNDQCDIAVQVFTRSTESPFPDAPEAAQADPGKIGQLTIDVVI